MPHTADTAKRIYSQRRSRLRRFIVLRDSGLAAQS